jgi:glycosyltransferase involved in cell wall biosynthesis
MALRVLVSAYACEPGKGSEPAVGWNWVLQISRFHEVWVITRANNRELIEKALVSKPLPNVHWVYFDLPRWARFWKRGQRGVHLYYYLWQLGAYFVARRLHREVGFDLVHHVTFAQYWVPSFLGLLGPPFIWGPVGGGESAPRKFWQDFSAHGKLYEVFRDVGRMVGSLGLVSLLVARRARLALATTEQTAATLTRLGARHVVVHPEFGMTQEERRSFEMLPIRRQAPFRLISIGRLLHWKGFHLSLRAFARFQGICPDSEYWIVNEGPEMGRLKALTRRLGVEQKVTFWGKLPTLEDVYDKLAECDVLVHPALHEAFGNVCLEAMASGRPVICLDLGGPAVQVTDETGVRVPAISPAQVVTDLAAAMERLGSDPALRLRMGNAARRRVHEHFDWGKKAAFMMGLYEAVRKADGGPTGGEPGGGAALGKTGRHVAGQAEVPSRPQTHANTT